MDAISLGLESSGHFSDHVSKLAEFEEKLLTRLQDYSEDEIINIRMDARLLGIYSWRVECACDFELFNRQRLVGGRGRKDTAGAGIGAALLKRMKALGCSHMHLRRNAQIYREFGETLNTAVAVLPEKGFYLAALESQNPKETLELFITKKKENPKFNVASANRVILEQRKEKERQKQNFLDKHSPEPKKLLKDHILKTITVIEDVIKPSCPDTKFAKQFYGSLLQELRDHLNLMFEEDAAQALRKAWADGYRKENQMASQTGLPRETVSQIMRMLEDEGEFYIVDQRGETSFARGVHAKMWWRVGEPTGDGFTAPRI